ncbi:hypothetical protein BJ986_002000 [Phycicoccus badiiscoriae]|uniref:Uncharacterized protein n=1 Tax=Pedococcus badiiscoriae TaxID=642776 RepID=A0A852WE73_9MICO|nr:hypothetical protein [Pedococcus badiiscoriae]NYG07513.1 hypothetical protein [Pedococcus badiiscoriae]
MADHDDWTADDDARLRAALSSLRTEVESAPLPDARFVRARGRVLRRRRFLAVGAAAAAAAVVAGTIGYAAWNPAGDIVHLPAGRTTSTAPVTTTSPGPSPNTSFSLDKPGILPLAEEWETSLKLPAHSVQIVQATTLEGGVECADPMGKPTAQQSVTQAGSPVSAAATYWQTGGDKAKVSSLEQAVLTCQAGPGFTVKSESVGGYALYSYSAGAAGSGWFAVVPGDDGVELLQLIDPAHPDVRSGGFMKDELVALSELAQMRLGVYATGPLPTELTSPTGGSTKASEKMMIVSGPDPLPPSSLFVPASQWRNPLFGKGAGTILGQSADIGDIGVFCETKDFLSGFGGELGVAEISRGPGDATVIGHQRVRVDQSADPALAKDSVNAQLQQERALLAKGCTESDGTVTATRGPTEGTYLLTKRANGGATRTDYRWVGVTAMATPGAWTTVVFPGSSDGQGFQGTAAQGFAELHRLLSLAHLK